MRALTRSSDQGPENNTSATKENRCLLSRKIHSNDSNVGSLRFQPALFSGPLLPAANIGLFASETKPYDDKPSDDAQSYRFHEIPIQALQRSGVQRNRHSHQAGIIADEAMHYSKRYHFAHSSLGTNQDAPLLRRNTYRMDRRTNVKPNLSKETSAFTGQGQPLPAFERDFFEPRFQHDFSLVRIHTDSRALATARAINAKAFTVGQHIAFGNGSFNPGSSGMRRLLAHELTHVLQQSGGLERGAGHNRPQIHALSTPSVQRLTERDLRLRELRRRAEALSIEDIQLRIVELQAELGESQTEGQHTRVPEEEEPLLPESRRARPPLEPPATPRRGGVEQNQSSLELEALQWELRRRQRREHRLFLESFADILDQRGSGWHVVLPQSTISEITTTRGARARGARPRVEPTVRYPAGRSSMERIDREGLWEEVRPIYLQRVRERLAQVAIPTESGQLRMWGSRGQRGANELPGYVWGRREDLPEDYAPEYEEFWQEVRGARTREQARAVGVELRSATDVNMWDIFLFLTGEGDPAAINTWDDQLLTVGAGFSARSGNAAQLYARMPPAFHDLLYRHGIFIDQDTNEFVVLDLNRGAVVRGDNALRILQVDQQRLSLLINTAMSAEPMSGETGGEREEAPTRVWMLRANFDQFRHINRHVPAAVWRWPQARRRYAFLIHHWMGSVDWPGMSATGGAPRALAVYAYHRLLPRFAGREEYLWNRLQNSARRAHAGAIGARPRAGAEEVEEVQ
jgi:hypothetical protein